MNTERIGVFSADHLVQILGDGLRLSALLRADAAVCARGVYEADDRAAELFGQLHLAQRLAVALRVGAAEVAGDALLDVVPLFQPDDRHRHRAEQCQSGHDRAVVRIAAVAVHFGKGGENAVDVVGRGRPRGVARRLDLFVGRHSARVQAENLGDVLLLLSPFDDVVNKALFQQKFGALEVFRQLLVDGLLDHALTGEADERLRLGDDDVAEEREATRSRRPASGR